MNGFYSDFLKKEELSSEIRFSNKQTIKMTTYVGQKIQRQLEHFFVFMANQKKECKDKNDVKNTWEEVADELDFIENSRFFILSEFLM